MTFWKSSICLLNLRSSVSNCWTHFCRLSHLVGQPDHERVLVVPNFFYSRMMGATVLLGTFSAVLMFLESSPDLCLDTVQSLSSGSVDLMLVPIS